MLTLIRYLLAERAFTRISIFEQRSQVGGLWNYLSCDEASAATVPIPQTNPHAPVATPVWRQGPQVNSELKQSGRIASFMSPVYDRLETNIPKDLMGFSDLAWPSDYQLFPKHSQVLEYLKTYARDVEELISFNTQVLDVKQKVDDSSWSVTTRALSPQDERSECTTQHNFDAVIVANGHYDVPHIPAVAGMEAWNQAFPGAISHSMFYRKPENYADKKVIIVGNSASGIDIGAQIATVCKLPLLQSQKSESYLSTGPSPGKQEKPEIVEYTVENRSVRFKDGTVESDIDAVVYCTGYFYSYPFLDSLDPPLVTTGERVENTFQHIFYQPNPTLALLVLNQKVIPFPVAEAQSAVVARVLSGRLPLPSSHEMQAWEEHITGEMGKGKAFHVLQFPKDAEYINMLHQWARSADEERTSAKVEGQTVGKTPPWWGERERWTRERFPAIKKAFQDCGEERHSKLTLADIGYDFETWRVERAQEQRKLL